MVITSGVIMDLYGKQKSYTYFTMDGVKIHLGFKEADELGRCKGAASLFNMGISSAAGDGSIGREL